MIVKAKGKQVPIVVTPDLFNPLFFKIRDIKTRVLVNYGGGGSGKSYSQAQYEVLRATGHYEKTLILRKVSTTLKDSVIPLVYDELITKFGLRHIWKLNKSDRELTNKFNGSKILFRGMDDPEKIKSIQGITRVWGEEFTEFDENDFDQLNIRLRGLENLRISLTYNPIDENHWVKPRFHDAIDDDITVIHTTYKDNKFIDEAFKKQIEKYRATNYNFYKVYALGVFGKTSYGGEFYKQFLAERNVGSYKYDPSLPLHISFDENVNPYMPCTIHQIIGKKCFQIDEICGGPIWRDKKLA